MFGCGPNTLRFPRTVELLSDALISHTVSKSMLSQENVEVAVLAQLVGMKSYIYEKETGLPLCILISTGAYVARACKGEALSSALDICIQRCVGQRKANMKHAQDVFPNPYLTLYLNESRVNGSVSR